MKYKLLALDLDGTLTNTKKEITPYTRRTIIKAQQKGVKIILATGRPTYGVAPIAEHLCLMSLSLLKTHMMNTYKSWHC